MHHVTCHKAQIISDWFLEHDNEFTLLKWPPQSRGAGTGGAEGAAAPPVFSVGNCKLL